MDKQLSLIPRPSCPAPTALGEEGYELRVTADRVDVRANTPAGRFYAEQTLRQLPAEARRAGAHIVDTPRFRWRGVLLDVCRHFRDVAFLKRTLDAMALLKLNVLHWHLTEDQGWRLAIDRYPQLTAIGAWRQGHAAPLTQEAQPAPGGRYGGFYTKEEVRDVVQYAAARHITVMPEIELPGHCVAALAAFPELSCTGGPFAVATRGGIFDDVYCAGNEDVFTFLEHVLDEVLALFPSPFIHIGGDEVPKTRWKACPKCQQRMRAEGLKDEHELQSYFIRRIERYLNARGRRLIGWDEILEGGLAPHAAVMSWRGMEGGIAAASAGHDVVMTPHSHCYLNFDDTRISLAHAYEFEPVPPALAAAQSHHVLGLQANLWSEYTLTDDDANRHLFPRLCALAEVAWTDRAQRDWADFQRRLPAFMKLLEPLGIRC